MSDKNLIKCSSCYFESEECDFPDLFYTGCGHPKQEALQEELQLKGFNIVNCGVCGSVNIIKTEALLKIKPVECTDFIDDMEKMRDFFKCTKQEFLDSYSYLTEEEYNNTNKKVGSLLIENKVTDEEYKIIQKLAKNEPVEVFSVLTDNNPDEPFGFFFDTYFCDIFQEDEKEQLENIINFVKGKDDHILWNKEKKQSFHEHNRQQTKAYLWIDYDGSNSNDFDNDFAELCTLEGDDATTFEEIKNKVEYIAKKYNLDYRLNQLSRI